MELAGETVTAMPTAHRIRRGLAIVPENRRVFGPMSVLENLEMGAYLTPKADLRAEFERVYTLFPLLYERRSQLAGTLSGGEQQMLAMGRALMSRPKLLLMDEPSMGLAPILVERSFEIIKEVHEAGVAMLVVEQNANVSLSIADRGYVLSTGRVVLEGEGRRPARARGAAEGVPREMTVTAIPPRPGSELALETIRLDAGVSAAVGGGDLDALLFVFAGGGTLTLGGEEHPLATGSAALALAGEEARLLAGPEGLAAACATVGPATDRHAPLGPRETVVPIDAVAAGSATGSRSYQVLLGPHNGSTRATLFAGYVPPGRAPWHYHLYDEIVWIWRGTGRLHLESGVEELAPGSAFRLAPREVHIVENLSADDELAVLGIFTPAGSPSAAYLPAG